MNRRLREMLRAARAEKEERLAALRPSDEERRRLPLAAAAFDAHERALKSSDERLASVADTVREAAIAAGELSASDGPFMGTALPPRGHAQRSQRPARVRELLRFASLIGPWVLAPPPLEGAALAVAQLWAIRVRRHVPAEVRSGAYAALEETWIDFFFSGKALDHRIVFAVALVEVVALVGLRKSQPSADAMSRLASYMRRLERPERGEPDPDLLAVATLVASGWRRDAAWHAVQHADPARTNA